MRPRHPIPVDRAARPAPRRGAVLVQSLVMLTVLIAIASLGADYGRVQLARAELERSASAAARAAASIFLSDQSAARDLAVAYGSYNKVDGAALVIDRNQDVEFGTWNAAGRSFTPLGGAASGANAVRVTARRTAARGNPVSLLFGSLVGKSTADVSASSVVCATSSQLDGFVGLDNLEMKNNFYAASYNSNAGPPGGGNIGSAMILGSNGVITIGNNADLYGSLVKGPAAAASIGSNFYITGAQTTQSSPITYPPTEAATIASSGAFNGDDLTLPAGTYYYTSITFPKDGTITTTGKVTIYVSGDITAEKSLTLTPHQSKPSNLRIRMIGAGTFEAKNNVDGAGEIYGPAATLSFKNNLTFAGFIVARSLSVKNNAELYRDTASGSGGGTVVISTVR